MVDKLFGDLFEHVLDTTMIYCGNWSGIQLLDNPILKHIEIRYHYIWDMVHKGALRLQHRGSDEALA